MTFDSFDTSLWPFVFIFLAASLPTQMWRWAAVLFASDIDSNSEWLVLIRCVSTALVAAVVAQFIVFPTGALAEVPVLLRIASAALGFAVYLKTYHLFAGIVAGEGALIIGYLYLGL